MSTPYYQDGHVTLYHGDCLELANLWTRADVLVTDPPYGIAYRSGRTPRTRQRGREAASTLIEGDGSTQLRDAVLMRWGTKPALVFGTWKAARPQQTRQVLIWDKTLSNGLGAPVLSPWASNFEEIYVCGPWPPVITGGDAACGTPGRESGILSVPNYNTQSVERPDHPTPKPVPLMERLIRRCAPGVIVDPFAGSGSTLVAAKQLGRKAVGVELDERYCELIARRCSQEVLDFVF